MPKYFVIEKLGLGILQFVALLAFPSFSHAVGYSYARFVGPVRGPEHEVLVPDEFNGGTRVDYVARPEYEFSYGVEDSETQVLQNRKEIRDGDAVKGVYSLVDPNGILRVVKYTADDLNGFQAEVIMDGVAINHGQHTENNINTSEGANYHVEPGDGNYESNQNKVENDNDDKDDGGPKNDYEVHEEYDENSDESKSNDAEGTDESRGEDSNEATDDEYYISNESEY